MKDGGWSWAAFFLGSLWYLFNGMTKKGIVLLLISVFTGLAALPFIHIYAGVKARSDLFEYTLKEKSKIDLNAI